MPRLEIIDHKHDTFLFVNTGEHCIDPYLVFLATKVLAQLNVECLDLAQQTAPRGTQLKSDINQKHCND